MRRSDSLLPWDAMEPQLSLSVQAAPTPRRQRPFLGNGQSAQLQQKGARWPSGFLGQWPGQLRLAESKLTRLKR